MMDRDVSLREIFIQSETSTIRQKGEVALEKRWGRAGRKSLLALIRPQGHSIYAPVVLCWRRPYGPLSINIFWLE
ncbi:MAG: hypothetical protein C4B58_09105 [Deltaproteobacteria bacterium]|nr:MAG: hypothetical protein C4B58_09105 [Deltaproteobacteria bacterium]